MFTVKRIYHRLYRKAWEDTPAAVNVKKITERKEPTPEEMEEAFQKHLAERERSKVKAA